MHGTDQYIKFGDENDPKAVNVFVEGDQICSVDIPYIALDCWDHKNSPTWFHTLHRSNENSMFTVNANGTISCDKDPHYFLGTDESEE